jgi:hypothetical protein
MIQQHDHNMSPYEALETARYLTDPQIIREYGDLQRSQFGESSSFQKLCKKPKFRLFMLRLSRLALFAVFLSTAIATISRMERWNDIYFWLHRLL